MVFNLRAQKKSEYYYFYPLKKYDSLTRNTIYFESGIVEIKGKRVKNYVLHLGSGFNVNRKFKVKKQNDIYFFKDRVKEVRAVEYHPEMMDSTISFDAYLVPITTNQIDLMNTKMEGLWKLNYQDECEYYFFDNPKSVVEKHGMTKVYYTRFDCSYTWNGNNMTSYEVGVDLINYEKLNVLFGHMGKFYNIIDFKDGQLFLRAYNGAIGGKLDSYWDITAEKLPTPSYDSIANELKGNWVSKQIHYVGQLGNQTAINGNIKLELKESKYRFVENNEVIEGGWEIGKNGQFLKTKSPYPNKYFSIVNYAHDSLTLSYPFGRNKIKLVQLERVE